MFSFTTDPSSTGSKNGGVGLEATYYNPADRCFGVNTFAFDLESRVLLSGSDSGLISFIAL